MTIKHFYPVVEPSLNLDFANSKKLDPRITFTRGSIGTYVGEDGLIKTAAQNEARFDHDSDGNSLGLLVEESRTNLLLQSEDFSTTWTPNRGSVTTNVIAAPNGTLTADKFSETADVGVSYPYQTVTINGVATFSVFVKAGERNYVCLYNSNAAVGRLFDIVNGAIGSTFIAAPIDSQITDAGGGWYRCSITFTGTGAAGQCRIYTAQNDSTVTANVEGEGFYLWGAQLEAGSFPTSYIPTSGSTVTRAADVASITGSNFSSWYRQDEGTVFAEGARNFTISSEFPRILSFGTAGSNTQLIDILGASGDDRLDVVTFGAVQAQLQIFPATAAFIRSSYAAAFKNNNFAFSRNGAAVVTDTSGTVPAVNQLRIGDRQDGARTHNGTIRRITYYPQRLPDATLQALTL